MVTNAKETPAELKLRAKKIYSGLNKLYPNAHCELDFKNPLQLLVATILAAQCTDKRVNTVTPALFRKYKKAEDFASAKKSELEELIHPTGFYKNKAASIIGMARKVCDEFGGKIPNNLDDLVTLPGVGRKTANVILGNAFNIPGITIDTHFGRLSRRFGWTKETDPEKVEFAMHEIFDPKYWTHLSQLVIWHGRRICNSRKPACGACPIADLCPSYGEGPTEKEIALKLVKKDSDFR
jgi:endonuclease-3